MECEAGVLGACIHMGTLHVWPGSNKPPLSLTANTKSIALSEVSASVSSVFKSKSEQVSTVWYGPKGLFSEMGSGRWAFSWPNVKKAGSVVATLTLCRGRWPVFISCKFSPRTSPHNNLLGAFCSETCTLTEWQKIRLETIGKFQIVFSMHTSFLLFQYTITKLCWRNFNGKTDQRSFLGNLEFLAYWYSQAPFLHYLLLSNL